MGDLVLADAAALAARTQGTVTYQIATALESSVRSLLEPADILVCVVLLCMYTEAAAHVLRVDVSIPRRVLLAQLGLSLMSAVDHALAAEATSSHVRFLLRTFTLCLPSVLGAASPAMLQNDYVQNALSTYVYRYAQNSQSMLHGLELGASPVYYVVLFIVMARHAALQRFQRSGIFAHVLQGWRLLLLDLLMRTMSQSTVGMPKLGRAALPLSVVLALDVLGLARWGMLQDVRGYAVFRAAQQLYDIQLLPLEAESMCAIAILTLCARSAVAHALVHKQANHAQANHAQGEHGSHEDHTLVLAVTSVSEIVFVGSINAILQNMVPTTAAGFVHFLLVSMLAVITCTTQRVLADAARAISQEHAESKFEK